MWADVVAALTGLAANRGGSPPSIAVLPFANMSGDKENEYFADGLAEEVLNALAQIAALKVIARTSSFGVDGLADASRLRSGRSTRGTRSRPGYSCDRDDRLRLD